MTVTVVIYGEVQPHNHELQINSDTTLEMIVDELNLESDLLLFINGVHAKPEQKLSHGDRVTVFPPIAGG